MTQLVLVCSLPKDPEGVYGLKVWKNVRHRDKNGISLLKKTSKKTLLLALHILILHWFFSAGARDFGAQLMGPFCSIRHLVASPAALRIRSQDKISFFFLRLSQMMSSVFFLRLTLLKISLHGLIQFMKLLRLKANTMKDQTTFWILL